VSYRTQKVAAGRTIFEEADKGNEFYLIEKGSVDVVRKIFDEEIILARLGKGQIFGEMAVLGDKKRTATVRAAEDCLLIIMDESMLAKEKSKAEPWFIKILDLLIKRLNYTNNKIRGHFKYGIEYSILYLTLLLSEKHGKSIEKTIDKKKTKFISLSIDFIKNKINKILGLSKEEIEDSLVNIHNTGLFQTNLREKVILIADEERISRFLKFIEAESFNKLEANLSDIEKKEKTKFIEIYKNLLKQSKSRFIYL